MNSALTAYGERPDVNNMDCNLPFLFSAFIPLSATSGNNSKHEK